MLLPTVNWELVARHKGYMDAAYGVVLGTCASGCETHMHPLTPTVRRCICRKGLPGVSGRREFPSGTDTIIYSSFLNIYSVLFLVYLMHGKMYKAGEEEQKTEQGLFFCPCLVHA